MRKRPCHCPGIGTSSNARLAVSFQECCVLGYTRSGQTAACQYPQACVEFSRTALGLSMNHEAHGARRYRFYAEELLAMADEDSHRRTRAMLIEVAQDYERMATSYEAIVDTYRLLD